jgi:D-glycero-D-manno-heptose 1,7-bisphosphate phosphatase
VTAGRAAVFFDRDGTLNEEVSFLTSPDQLRLILGASKAVRTLNTRGIPVCVISNQSAVARGLISEADLVPIHRKLAGELERDGAHIDRIYYCPHHPTDGIPPYNKECDCRKPRPGMLHRAAAELALDLRESSVIGDRIVDIQVAKAVGAKGILVLTGYGMTALEECREKGVTPDFIAPSVREAVEYVLETDKGDHHQDD